MRYFRKPIEVDAIKMTATFKVGDLFGKKGDYLITFPDGEIGILPSEVFEKEYGSNNLGGPIHPPFVPAIPSYDLEPVSEDSPVLSKPPVIPPTDEQVARIRLQEAQTSVMCCATCGVDTPRSKIDLNNDCPKCSSIGGPGGGLPDQLFPCPSCKSQQPAHKIVGGRCVDCLGGDD